jgi:hypothetical protein
MPPNRMAMDTDVDPVCPRITGTSITSRYDLFGGLEVRL